MYYLLIIFLILIQSISYSQTKNNTLNSINFEFNIIDFETKSFLNDIKIEIKNNCGLDTNLTFISKELVRINNINLCNEKINYDIDFNKLGYKEQHIVLKKSKNEILNSINWTENIEISVFLIPLNYKTATVVVTSENLNSNNHIGHSHTLDSRLLHKELSQTLANTLKNEVGFSMTSMGPATSRPVIRGLNGNRIQINEDGMPSIDISATSPDHSVTADANSAERIEIIRGPKVLVYTPVAISGVIDVIKNKLPFNFPHNINGSVYSLYESMNFGKVLGGNLEIPFGIKHSQDTLIGIDEEPSYNYLFKSNINYKSANDIQSAKKQLENSASESYNINSSVMRKNDYFDLGLSLNMHKNNYELPGGFVGAHPKGVDIELEKSNINLNSEIHIHKDFIDDIRFNLSRSYYYHTEYESNGNIGAQFKIENYFTSIDFLQHKNELFSDGLIGLSANIKDFKVGGFVFTPATTQYSIATYIYEEIDLDELEIQFSSRFYYDLFSPKLAVNVSPENSVQREFLNYSASVSLVKEFEEKYYIGLTLSRTSKSPTIEEMYSEGPHLAAYSYEVGNINLTPENGFGSEIFTSIVEENTQFSFNLYYNYFNSYITPRNTGKINFAQLLPIFATTGIRSRLYGIESKLDQKLSEDFALKANLSYTIGENLEENIPLPMIPPLKSRLELTYNHGKSIYSLYNNIALEQNRIDTFETITPGYAIFGAEYSTLINFDENVISLSLVLDNILNQEYYNHLSRIKSIMPEPGINLRANVKWFM